MPVVRYATVFIAMSLIGKPPFVMFMSAAIIAMRAACINFSISNLPFL